jgi:Domain of unknown function (DUF5666)
MSQHKLNLKGTYAMKRHNFKLLLILIFALTSAGFIAACGGSGTTNVADIGGGGTGITSSGTISGFGSVYVNGVKFSTSSATKIFDDDTSIGEDKLKVGQVVEIKGKSQDSANGSADSIAVLKELKGPVDVPFNSSVMPNTLGVMGQKVIIDNNTIVDNNITGGLAGLTLGTQVEVNGFRDPSGSIHATRIERQDVATTSKFKVSGVTSSPTTTSFNIGDLIVSYPGVVVKNLPAGGLVAGLRVEVKAAAAPSNNILNATSVEVKSGVSASNGDKGEVEGTIANFDGTCKFTINAQAVDACGSVVIEPAGSVLANGKRVEAEGTVTNGVLVAKKIEFKSSGSNSGGGGGSGGFSTFVRLNAGVQTLDSTNRTITALGKTFKLSLSTQFEDQVSNARPFNLDNFSSVLKAGDIVEIRGFEDNNGLNATLVERNKAIEIIIQGKLGQNNATQLTIQGVTVRVGTNTLFKNTSGVTIPRTDFDPAATLNPKVKAKGTNSGTSDNTVDATNGEVELET